MFFLRNPSSGPSTRRFRRCLFYLLALLSACNSNATHASRESREPAEKVRVRDSAVVPAVATAEPLAKRGIFLADVAERTKRAVVSVASTRVAKVETLNQWLDDPLLRRFFGPCLQARDRPTTPGPDLAVLRVTGDASNLSHLDSASSSQLRPREPVLAIGNPLRIGETVTMGIVSAKGRSDPRSRAQAGNLSARSGGALCEERSGSAAAVAREPDLVLSHQDLQPSVSGTLRTGAIHAGRARAP